MQRRIAFFMLIVFLFSALVPQQVKSDLQRLPALLEHFRKHKIEDPETSLFQFFKMHYGEQFAKHRSEHDHDQLPFKCDHHAHAFAGAVSFFCVDTPALQLGFCVPGIFSKPVFPPTDGFFSVEITDIWQPPRVVIG